MSTFKARKLNRLWIARKKAGLGQKSVARLLGYRSTSPVSEYEHSRLLPNLRTALKLSIIYETPLPKLYASLYVELEDEITNIRTGLTLTSGIREIDPHEKDPLKNTNIGNRPGRPVSRRHGNGRRGAPLVRSQDFLRLPLSSRDALGRTSLPRRISSGIRA